MDWEIEFYDTVGEELAKMPPKIQARMIRLMELMEKHEANLGEPHTKSLGGELFEIRAKAKEGIGRGIFCYMQGKRIIIDRKSTRLNSSHVRISYAVFCLNKKPYFSCQ